MKANLIKGVVFWVLTLVILAGCGGKSAEYAAKGAAGGAVSAALVGAVTDIIVDGQVNPHRLERNLVAGAVAGGVAGGIAGAKVPAQKDGAENQAGSEARPTQDDKYAQLEKEIGPENMKGLENLVSCQHNEAFAIGLNTEKSSNPEHSEAGLILQILVDQDRDNVDGVAQALDKLLKKNSQISSLDNARAELDKLWAALKDERRIQGKAPDCSK